MPSLDDRKRIIIDFLHRCNGYAEERLVHYASELDAVSPSQALAVQDKIGHWCAYRAFNEHAITELRQGLLDEWLGSD